MSMHVDVVKKTSDICPFRAGGQQTQVGLCQTEMCLFLGRLQFPDEGFLNCGIWRTFNERENLLKDNTR